jgi:phage terminase large subunit-like protein
MIREAGERAGDMSRAGEAFIAEWAAELGRQPTPDEMDGVRRNWKLIARPEQLPPEGDWDVWTLLAGRGNGKTRTGAETIKDWAESGTCRRLALVAPTADDARKVMVEGESGLLSLYADVPEYQRPLFEPSRKLITWPNGAIASLYSSEKPDRLRGPQHDGAWADELAAWATVVPKKDRSASIVQEGRPPAWDQLLLGLRLGDHPRTVVTTTPRPTPLIRALLRDPSVAISKGSTYDNATNLAPSFLRAILKAYEGTRIGRQELHAELLDDNPNALWKQTQIDALRVAAAPMEFIRAALAIDPAVSTNPDSDLTGIVGGGLAPCRLFPECGGELHAFITEDASDIFTPSGWAKRAGKMYAAMEADRIIGEVNNGGDLVEANVVANAGLPVAFRAVHASRGKYVRAEPVAALYEQGKVHHVGTHGKLEDEMTQWDPISGLRSPSRMDALVWLLTDLMLGEPPAQFEAWGSVQPRRV